MLFMPIVVPFYKSNGLSMQDIFILRAIYSIAIVVLEIPSGYFADVWGRKKTIIYGTLATFAGFVVYSSTTGFLGFLAAEIVLGIGTSLISGADSAMLYDTLLVQKKEQKYLRYEARMVSYGNFAEAIAGVIGGLIATIALRLPYISQAVISFVAIPVAFSLIEPDRHKPVGKYSFKNISKAIRFSLVEDKKLQRFILFSSIIGTATLTMAWFVQPVFELIGLPLSFFGILWTLLNGIVGVFALIAYKTERFLGKKNMLIVITLCIPAGYILVSLFDSYWTLLFIVFFYMIRGVATPVLKDYINKLTSSEIRATVLSVRNFIIRSLFVFIGPFLGWYTDNYSLQKALLLGGIFFFIISMILLFLMLKKK